MGRTIASARWLNHRVSGRDERTTRQAPAPVPGPGADGPVLAGRGGQRGGRPSGHHDRRGQFRHLRDPPRHRRGAAPRRGGRHPAPHHPQPPPHPPRRAPPPTVEVGPPLHLKVLASEESPPPTMRGAHATAKGIVVGFSKPMDPAGASNVNNYAVKWLGSGSGIGSHDADYSPANFIHSSI